MPRLNDLVSRPELGIAALRGAAASSSLGQTLADQKGQQVEYLRSHGDDLAATGKLPPVGIEDAIAKQELHFELHSRFDAFKSPLDVFPREIQAQSKAAARSSGQSRGILRP